MSSASSFDSRILELMASKICHDLISPIGAVCNGVEIMEEMGAEAGDDVVELIGFSATQANAKLKTLRMAYGLGGADENMKPADAHTVFGEYISGEKRLTQNWEPYTDIDVEPKRGYVKILLCGLLLMAEALPKGGELRARTGEDDSMIIEAQGENPHFRDGVEKALTHSISAENLDPKLVHAFITKLLADSYGFEISYTPAENDIMSLRIKSLPVS